MVPGKQVPHFKAGKELRERVDVDEPLALTASGQLDTNSSSDRSTLDQGLVTRQVAL
jgi:integration host factor subunit beta